MYHAKKHENSEVRLEDLITRSFRNKAVHGTPIWEVTSNGERVQKFFDLPTRSLKTIEEFLKLKAERAEARRRTYFRGRRFNRSSSRRLPTLPEHRWVSDRY